LQFGEARMILSDTRSSYLFIIASA
jgi:hypothetical protein